MHPRRESHKYLPTCWLSDDSVKGAGSPCLGRGSGAGKKSGGLTEQVKSLQKMLRPVVTSDGLWEGWPKSAEGYHKRKVQASVPGQVEVKWARSR